MTEIIKLVIAGLIQAAILFLAGLAWAKGSAVQGALVFFVAVCLAGFFWNYFALQKRVFARAAIHAVKALSKRSLVKGLLDWSKHHRLSVALRANCGLSDYQSLLQVLSDRAKSGLHWTNIYPPAKVFENGGAHREAFFRAKVRPEGKVQICFVNTGNEAGKGGWDDPVAKKQFEDKIPPSATLLYVDQEEITNGNIDGVILGDYAVFDSKIMVAFNPTTSREDKGDLLVTLGDVQPYLVLFEKARTGSYSDHFKGDVADVIARRSRRRGGSI